MAIPSKTYGGTIEGNLDGEAIHMDFDLSDEGRAHLISVMTDLYSDAELAVLREYSTNAYDSHIDAGKAGTPIHVTTPTSMKPYLVIQDFGIGMDVEDMRNVFSKYGASTKRSSNSVQGMLGLGGKSALTYTSQFTVTAIKNGVKTQVIVTRDENGIGVMNVVNTSRTNESNGVTIEIPAKSRHEFGAKAEKFFYYWNPGTVILNGREPKHLLNETKVSKVGPNTWIKSDSYYGDRDIIIMGNVAYHLPDRRLSEKITNNYYSIAIHYAEMGAVNFAPSREALSFTPKTTAYLDQVQKEMRDEIKRAIEVDLANAKTHGEAFEIWSRWVNIVGRDKLPTMTFRGEKFINSVDVQHFTMGIGSGRYNSNTGEYGNRSGESVRVYLAELNSPNKLIVKGYTNSSKPTTAAGKKMALYIEQNDLTQSDVLLFDKIPASPWTDDIDTIDWEDINSIPLPRNSGGGGVTGTIPVKIYRKGGYADRWRTNSGSKGVWDDVTQLDHSEKVLYVSPAEILSYMSQIHDVAKVFPNHQIVALGRNRWEKFLRENPNAIELSTYYSKSFTDDMEASMTADEIFYADHDSNYREIAKKAKNSDDPDFARLTKSVRTDTIEVYNRSNPATKELHKKYPLLYSRHYNTSDKHIILYINAVYNEGN